jgi:hypothetical protein
MKPLLCRSANTDEVWLLRRARESAAGSRFSDTQAADLAPSSSSSDGQRVLRVHRVLK